MKQLQIGAAVASVLLLSAPAQASTSSPGYVLGFATISTNIMLVWSDGARSTPPSCSNAGFPQRWAFDTPMGQAMLSLSMTAKASHEQVTLYGTGSCSVLGDSETIGSVVTNALQ